ncbi:cytochrome C biogenesis protein [Parahaliea sp. F7430]|uniref:Cytochrome C biogenesis protein n=1 Tax=Sediminihaliea albiluteola TaxID=2758564 RepID=A0A7W2TUZ7_9GAMM|nr:cytochrome C biogenesis protein [Sediminihaliea albiluteola]MBA6412427.1 cytochrome C biogenesis protein [Sediminihaliea albiluteola]
MTTFMLACAGLIIFSGLFYLFPRRRRGNDAAELERANLDWYHLRKEELSATDSDELQRDAQLRLLEDEQASKPAGELPGQATGSFPTWLLLPLVAVASAALYYKLGAASDVLLNQRIAQLDQNASASEVYSLMGAMEKRSQQRPDNLHYRALLGRFYMGQEDYSRAAETYSALAEAAPGDAYALAYAAQASYLAAGRVLDAQAQHMAEQSLALNPHQRTALGLLGMVSFERGQYRAAIQYWERLRVMEQPGSESERMISEVINEARAQLGEAPALAASAEAGSDETQPAGLGVTVRLSLPQDAVLAANDTVFVLARSADSSSRMPIAVQRLRAAQLPLTLRLDDSNSMAGQKLSESESLVVVVQVSPTGQPGEANATWLGQAGPLQPSVDGEPVEIRLTPREG